MIVKYYQFAGRKKKNRIIVSGLFMRGKKKEENSNKLKKNYGQNEYNAIYYS